MDGSMFRGLDKAIMGLFYMALVGIVLGIWKVIDIAIWLWHHVSVNWN